MKEFIFCVTILICMLPSSLSGQIVNTEKYRKNYKENGWFGEYNFSLGLSRNKAGQVFEFHNQGRVEYVKNSHKWMFLGNYHFSQLSRQDDSTLVTKRLKDNAFAHLRYNYTLGHRITLEAFGQVQFNDIQEIRLRSLLGTGPRFKIRKTDSSHLYIGSLMMFEYEESLNELDLITFHRDVRWSNYISLAYEFRNRFTINQVTYYQPNISSFSDYRISSDTKLNFVLTKGLSFFSNFQLIYDSQPAETVPPIMFNLKQGLEISF